jgi:hypothetical protein
MVKTCEDYFERIRQIAQVLDEYNTKGAHGLEPFPYDGEQRQEKGGD